MGTSGERMTFWERVSNFINYMIFTYYQTRFGYWAKQNAVWVDHCLGSPHQNRSCRPPDTDRPVADFGLAGNVQHILVNGEPMLDFPRPLTMSTSYMGSVLEPFTRGTQQPPLPDEWTAILGRPGSKGTILVSFGTMLSADTVCITW